MCVKEKPCVRPRSIPEENSSIMGSQMGFQNLLCILLNDRPNFLTVFARHQKTESTCMRVGLQVMWFGSGRSSFSIPHSDLLGVFLLLLNCEVFIRCLLWFQPISRGAVSLKAWSWSSFTPLYSKKVSFNIKRQTSVSTACCVYSKCGSTKGDTVVWLTYPCL